MTTPRFDIQQLLDPAVYPWPVDKVELIETHISWVLLAGDRVVKLKRPVDLGFVDFRDPARRKQACEDEIRLNRRLTTDVYLGVVPITANGIDAPGEPLEWATLMRRMPANRMLDLLLNEGTAPANLAELLATQLIPFHSSSRAESRALSLPEHPSSAVTPIPTATQPRSPMSTSNPSVILNEVKDLSPSELPSASLSTDNPPTEKQEGEPPRGEILRVAQNDNEGAGDASRTESRAENDGAGVGDTPGAVARATRGPSTSLGTTEEGLTEACPTEPDVYLKVLTDNLDQVADAAGDILGKAQLELVARSMRDFMDAERALLDERFDAWLVEGHGDLRCEHICLEADAIQIYDCVEFEIAIRCADVASDLAFLLMDLRRLGARPVADELLQRYRAAGFDLPQPVVDLYAAHRALVRAKVAALERSGRDPESDLARAFEAAAYLDLATAFATPIAPVLVLVSGLSGSGKSTVAAAIGRITGGTIFASDRVRKELAGLTATDPAAADWQQGIYSGDWTARTYDRLLESATAELARGHAAIVDATFLDNERRERFVAAARAAEMPAAIVWTELDDATARTRIERRARKRQDPSDAGIAIRERQQEQLRAQPLRIPHGAIAATIDTSQNGPASLDPLVTAFGARGLIGALAGEQVTGHA
jgi:aminoglycoside phosphotransferase family enzyme/predicted kinase